MGIPVNRDLVSERGRGKDRFIVTTLAPGERTHLVVYCMTVAAVGIPLGIWMWVRGPHPDPVTMVLFGVLGLVSYHLPVLFPSNLRMNPGFPLLMSAFFTHGAPAALLVVIPSYLLHFFTIRHGLVNCLFNAGQMSICITVANTMGRLAGWRMGVPATVASLLPIGVMAGCHDLVNTLLVLPIIRMQDGRRLGESFRRIHHEHRRALLPLLILVTVTATLLASHMGNSAYVLVFLGVLTIRKQTTFQEELVQKTAQAEKDALTDTYNLHYLSRWAETAFSALAKAKRNCSFVFVDLCELKMVNDTYGHQTGDRSLIHAANIITSTVRKVDSVVRYGGDEFVVVCPDTSMEGAAIVGRRIAETLAANPFCHLGAEVHIGASIGVATWPAHGETYADVIRLADKAMYLAKKRGPNTVCTVADL